MKTFLEPVRNALGHLTSAVFYHKRYFGMVDEAASRSAAAMAAYCCEIFHPRCAIDYGCGTGAFLAALRANGVFVAGTEVSPPARRMCDHKKVPTIPLNLADEHAEPPFGVADLATSFEVAEHLPGSAAAGFARLLSRSAPIVVFSAATPGQGGQGHINEQPRGYWIEHFRAAGMNYDENLSVAFSSAWKASDVEWWYVRNVMIFRSSSAAAP